MCTIGWFTDVKLCLLYINYVFQFGFKLCIISLLYVCLLLLQLSKAHKESVSLLFSSLLSSLVSSLLFSSLVSSLLFWSWWSWWSWRAYPSAQPLFLEASNFTFCDRGDHGELIQVLNHSSLKLQTSHFVIVNSTKTSKLQIKVSVIMQKDDLIMQKIILDFEKNWYNVKNNVDYANDDRIMKKI